MSKINKKQLQDGAVDSSIVEDDSLTTDDYGDGSILNEDISNDAAIELHKLNPVGAVLGESIIFNGTVWAKGTGAGISLHSLAGALHDSATLSELNAKISDATLIDTGDSRLSDSRTPTSHASTHVNGTDDIQDATASQKGLATAAQITKLDGIEALADVTDTANVDAAGATMNADADISANSWVLNEGTLASNSAIKVPTQQSVKTYVDNLSITKMTDVDTTTTAPVIGDIMEWNGSLWVPAGPKPRVRQDTKTTLGSTGDLLTNPAAYRTWTITNLPAGDYKFEWFYVWAYSSASADFYARVDAAGTTMVEHRQEPKDSGTDQRNPECGFGYVSFATTANRTFTIYYGCESSGQTASIHRSIMTLSPVQLV